MMFKIFKYSWIVAFLLGVLVGIVCCITAVYWSNQSKTVFIKVSNVYHENTNLQFRKLFELNELLRMNSRNNAKYEWSDTLVSVSDYLSLPECMCSWDSYVVDSCQSELLVVRRYSDSSKEYYLLTKGGLFDVKFIPLVFKFDTLIYKRDAENRWVR